MTHDMNIKKTDKETHTPMLKVFKDLMRIKNDSKEDPERKSLLERKYVDNNLNVFTTKNMENEKIYSDTSYSACVCTKESTGSPMKRQGIEICDSLYLRRYGKGEMKKEKRKSDKEEKKLKTDKKQRSNDFREQTFQLGGGLRRDGSKSRYRKLERQESVVSERSCCFKKLAQITDCRTLILMVMMAIAVACTLGYSLKTKKNCTKEMYLNHGTVKTIKTHQMDSDYNTDDEEEELADHKKDSDTMLRNWSIHRYDMNNVEFADGDDQMADNYDEKYSPPVRDSDSLNLLKFDYDTSNTKLKNFYNKLLQMDATIEKLKAAQMDGSLRAKRSLRFRRMPRYRIKLFNTKKPATTTTKKSTTSFIKRKSTTETKPSSVSASKTTKISAANGIASTENIIFKVIVQPRLSKCSHVNTVNSKSHENELKRPYYKITQRVDELLDPKAEYSVKTTKHDRTPQTTTSKVEKISEKLKPKTKQNTKENMSELNTDMPDATDISLDYYMGLPIMYFDNVKDFSSKYQNKQQQRHQKTNQRNLQQADDSYDDTIQYEELQDATKEEISNKLKDSASINYLNNKLENALHAIKSLPNFGDTNKHQLEKITIPVFNTNWKGIMTFDTDFKKAIWKKTPESLGNKKSDKSVDIDGGLVSDEEIADKDDIQYIVNPSDETQRSAQCYSDYGVLDNEKKENKFNKNQLYTKLSITDDSLSVSSSTYYPNDIPRYFDNRQRLNDLVKTFPYKANNLKQDFYIDFHESRKKNEDEIVRNKHVRRQLMSIDDTGSIKNELLSNEPREKLNDYEDYFSYDYSLPPTVADILYMEESNKTNKNSTLIDKTKNLERSKRDTTKNYKNTDAAIQNKTISLSEISSQNTGNETGKIKNNKFINFVTNIFNSFSKLESSKKENLSNKAKNSDTTSNDKFSGAPNRLFRIPVVATDDDSSFFDNTTTQTSDKMNENLSATTDAITNKILTSIDSVKNESLGKDNKTIVKRNAPIADSGFIFWNEMYNDNYSIESDLADYANTTDEKRLKRNKTDSSSCRGWIYDRIKNIRDKFRFGKVNSKLNRVISDSDELSQGANVEGKPDKSNEIATGKRIQRNIDNDFSFTTASYAEAVDSRTHSTHNEKEVPSKISFAKLTANLKEVCKEAAQAVYPATKVHSRDNGQSDGRTNLIMAQLVKMMTNLIDEQVQKKTCLTLPRDLQKFLNQLTARDPDNDVFEDEPTIYRKVKEKRKHSFEVNPTNLELGPNLEHKSKCLDVLKGMQALQAEYDQFSDEEKQTLKGVKEYLDEKQSYIFDQLQDPLLPTTEVQESRFCKETRSKHIRNIRPIIYKRNAFKFIKKPGNKRTRSTIVENIGTEAHKRAKSQDLSEPHHIIHDGSEQVSRSHDTTESSARDYTGSIYRLRGDSQLRAESHDDTEFEWHSLPRLRDDDKNFDKRNLKDVYFKAVSEANKVYSTVRAKQSIEESQRSSDYIKPYDMASEK